MRNWIKKAWRRLFPGKEHKRIVKVYAGQGAVYQYSVAAILFFGFQTLVATLGALELVFPDLPAPITFQVGRAIHLNLSIYWPLLGSMGAALFFFVQEAQADLRPRWMAFLLFYLLIFNGAGILVSLALGYTEGREYLEAIRPFDWLLVLSMLLFLFLLFNTFLRSKTRKKRPTLLAILLGALSLVIFYLPNMIFYENPSADEVVRFWVVHLWEEMSLELVSAGVIAAFLLAVTESRRRQLEKILYLDLALVFVTGFLATGHHYYWVGTPKYWLAVGGIFSTIQLIPILLLFYETYRALKPEQLRGLEQGAKLGLAFLASSVFYHVFGAGVLGWIMAVPRFNRYLHGTYLTSAHAHFALFGVFGFLVLAMAVYILADRFELPQTDYRRVWRSLILLNAGLLLMGGALTAAGFLESYLWRIAGQDFMAAQRLLRPYLMLRAAGGAIFAAGALLLAWTFVKLAWKNKWAVLFGKID